MDMRVTRSGGACGSKGSDFWGELRDERAQGTTEYAILVGVLVVIAIIAVLIALADFYDTTTDYILGRSSERHPPRKRE